VEWIADQQGSGKCAFEGMNAADLARTLELASLTVIMLEGSPQTASLNRELALSGHHGGKAIWLASGRMTIFPSAPPLRAETVLRSNHNLASIVHRHGAAMV
jgi:hypothetical protein